MNGQINNIRIWPRALSLRDVLRLVQPETAIGDVTALYAEAKRAFASVNVRLDKLEREMTQKLLERRGKHGLRKAET